ncbi:MAG TPA: cytochrome c-type biogenesis protein [Pseudolabrys sp.]|nr:cytochrome c-type biogenesis protein [Pseudolabrys sp.]
MRRFVLIALLTLFLAPGLAHAVTPDEMLKDPVLEARARNLSQELRCMVCQNQSIDDSEAPLAKDIRLLVRERLVQGDSDKQVLDFLVARYGEFVLLKPPFQVQTLLLWGLSPLALLIGIGALFLMARRRKTVIPETTALTPEEQRRLTGIAAADSPRPLIKP